jgi:hypothetical protein
MEQREAIKFCAKLKERGIEAFGMLKRAYDEVYLSRRSVFEWYESYTEAQNVIMQKSLVATMLTAFFYAEGIIHQAFVPEKQTVNGKFRKSD